MLGGVEVVGIGVADVEVEDLDAFLFEFLGWFEDFADGVGDALRSFRSTHLCCHHALTRTGDGDAR